MHTESASCSQNHALPKPKYYLSLQYHCSQPQFLSKIHKPVSIRLITSAVISSSIILRAAGNTAHNKCRNTWGIQTKQNLLSTLSLLLKFKWDLLQLQHSKHPPRIKGILFNTSHRWVFFCDIRPGQTLILDTHSFSGT